MRLLNKPKITVVGSCFVGMSLAVLFAQHNDVTVLDVDLNKINKISNEIKHVRHKIFSRDIYREN